MGSYCRPLPFWVSNYSDILHTCLIKIVPFTQHLFRATFANLLIGASHLTNHNAEKTVKLKSTDFYIHPDYSAEKIMNDVGLVKLPENVPYSENIRPICLPLKRSQNEDIDGRFMVAAGWGKTSDGNSNKFWSTSSSIIENN